MSDIYDVRAALFTNLESARRSLISGIESPTTSTGPPRAHTPCAAGTARRQTSSPPPSTAFTACWSGGDAEGPAHLRGRRHYDRGAAVLLEDQRGRDVCHNYCWVCRFDGDVIVEARAYLDSAMVDYTIHRNENLGGSHRRSHWRSRRLGRNRRGFRGCLAATHLIRSGRGGLAGPRGCRDALPRR